MTPAGEPYPDCQVSWFHHRSCCTVCTASFSTCQRLEQECSTRAFPHPYKERLSHVKEISETAKCAHQNIQKGFHQREKKKYNYLPSLMTLEGLLDYHQFAFTSISRLQLLHLKPPQTLPCPEDFSSHCPPEA